MDLAAGIALIEQLDPDAPLRIELRSISSAMISDGTTAHSYRVKVRFTPPTPASVRRDLNRIVPLRDVGDSTRLLYVVPRLTASLRAAALEDPRIAVAAVDDAAVVIDTIERRQAQPAPQPRSPRGRRPWARFALMRALLRTDEPRSQTALAAETSVTQQAIAYALPSLASLGVNREQHGWVAQDPARLWASFIHEYPGPGGMRRRWSSAATLQTQVDRVLDQARGSHATALMSGDVAADRQAPHRRPTAAVVIATADIDLTARFALVTDPAEDATMSVVVPADQTLFATAQAWNGLDPALTDPLITAWEVARSRGADRADAVESLRKTVLGNRAHR